MTSGALPAGGAGWAERPGTPGQGRERGRERTAGNDEPRWGGGAAVQWGFLFSLPSPRVPPNSAGSCQCVSARFSFFPLFFHTFLQNPRQRSSSPARQSAQGPFLRSGDWRLPAPRAPPDAAESLGTSTQGTPGVISGRAAKRGAALVLPSSASHPRTAERGIKGTWAQLRTGAGGCGAPQPPCVAAGWGGGETSALRRANPSGWHREARRAFPRPALPPVSLCGRFSSHERAPGSGSGPRLRSAGRRVRGSGAEHQRRGARHRQPLSLSLAGLSLRRLSGPRRGSRGALGGSGRIALPGCSPSPRRCTSRHGENLADLRSDNISMDSFTFLIASVVSFLSPLLNSACGENASV